MTDSAVEARWGPSRAGEVARLRVDVCMSSFRPRPAIGRGRALRSRKPRPSGRAGPRAAPIAGPYRRRGRPLALDPQGADVRAERRHRRRSHRIAARAARRRRVTGISLRLAARRDAHAYALSTAAYDAEARAWRSWLIRACAGHPPQMQILYGLSAANGASANTPSMAGRLRRSRPVRASERGRHQFQLDVTAKSWTPCTRRAVRQSCARRARGVAPGARS